MTGLSGLPLRDGLSGQEPYGAPQLDVAVRLNVNENPYPPSESLVADIGGAVADVAGDLNRYPDREAWALRQDLAADVAKCEGVTVDPAHVWAANGSKQGVRQPFLGHRGPGRTALGFTATYSIYPEYCRDTFTHWVTEPREHDFALTPEAAHRA